MSAANRSRRSWTEFVGLTARLCEIRSCASYSSNKGQAYEPRLRKHGRDLIDSFTSLAVAELTRLTESGEAACTDPEAVAVLMRTATIGWIAAHASGTADVDHERLLDVLDRRRPGHRFDRSTPILHNRNGPRRRPQRGSLETGNAKV